MPLPKPEIAPYLCKHHYWTSWRHYGCKMWDSGCRLKEKGIGCGYLDAARCPGYAPKDSAGNPDGSNRP